MTLMILKRFISAILFLNVCVAIAEPLSVGIVSYDPPFVVRADKDHYFGFDVELMTQVCAEMQAQCALKPMAFNQLFVALNDGTIDLAIAAITITEERQRKYSFSLPYLISNARFITNQQNTPVTINELNKKSIGVLKGSIYKEWTNTKLPNVYLTEYSTSEQLVSALSENKIDVALMDDFSADYWLTNNTALFTAIGEPFLIGSGYGIMAKNNSPILITRVDTALRKITDNEFYLSLYRKYFYIIPTHP